MIDSTKQRTPLAVSYDEARDRVTIDGRTFSGDFFRFLTAPHESVAAEMTHDAGGAVTWRRLDEPATVEQFEALARAPLACSPHQTWGIASVTLRKQSADWTTRLPQVVVLRREDLAVLVPMLRQAFGTAWDEAVPAATAERAEVLG